MTGGESSGFVSSLKIKSSQVPNRPSIVSFNFSNRRHLPGETTTPPPPPSPKHILRNHGDPITSLRRKILLGRYHRLGLPPASRMLRALVAWKTHEYYSRREGMGSRRPVRYFVSDQIGSELHPLFRTDAAETTSFTFGRRSGTPSDQPQLQRWSRRGTFHWCPKSRKTVLGTFHSA